MRRVIRRVLIPAALVFIIVAIIGVITPQGRVAIHTLLFLPQVLPGLPFKPQQWLIRSPIREEVRFPIKSGDGAADLYVPAGGGKHSAVLLFLGVNPAGRDDPRVVGLAEGLARTGTVVMIPWSDSMTQKRVTIAEIDNLVMAFQYLRGLDIVDSDRVGMGGFCVGASFATVAAQDVRIHEQVRFVNFFGGYYDALDLVKSVVTRSRFYGGEVEGWNPNSLSVEVVTVHLIEGVQDKEERRLLTQTFLESKSKQAINLERLSLGATAVYKLLEGPDFDEVDKLLGQLPEATLDSLRRISPSANLERLRARVLIMHDREDDLVPSEESRRFVDSLDENQSAYYTEFSLFQHVDPTRAVSPPVFVREAFKLFLHMYNVIDELS